MLALAAVVCRAPLFGDPLIHVDETFYNLVGARMLHGAVPFVDIWDRKPIGLFLIYAFAHAVFGAGVIGYQILATGFVIATAIAIERVATRIADQRGAALAGLAYIIGLSLFRCSGGQSPVFYNLPMVLAASVILGLVTGHAREHLLRRGMVAMLLVGIALQIKYTVVFEGIAFGIALLFLRQRSRCGIARIAVAKALWIASALVPTALALGWYVWRGYGQDFIWANFISIFFRDTGSSLSWDRLSDLLTDIGLSLPFWGTIAVFLKRRNRPDYAPATNAARPLPDAWCWLAAWAAAAAFGFMIFGTYYDHYTAALLPSFSILAAPALGFSRAKRINTALVFVFLIVAGTGITIGNYLKYGSKRDLDHMAALISPNLHGRCLYVYQGNSALYSATHACIVSKFVFPSHLSHTVDRAALGIAPTQEMHNLLSKRPGVIVTRVHPDTTIENWNTRRVLDAALAQRYVAYARAKLGKERFTLYRLRSD